MRAKAWFCENGVLGMVSSFLCVLAVIYGPQLFKYIKSLANLIGSLNQE